MKFELPKLSFAYDALEPFYDRQTVEIHHTKHHQAYTNNLNKALEESGLAVNNIEDLLKNLNTAPAAQKTALTNHGGGFYNHNIFWESLAAAGKSSAPSGKLAQAIEKKWGSMGAFQDEFSKKALGHFGSGWAWLVVNTKGDLEITDTHDQASPISQGHKPILTLDVWEHAYYLKYKNVRADWIAAFWKIVNWDAAEDKFKS